MQIGIVAASAWVLKLLRRTICGPSWLKETQCYIRESLGCKQRLPLKRGCFCPQGTFGNIWRHFWLSVTTGGPLASAGYRDAMNANMHRTASTTRNCPAWISEGLRLRSPVLKLYFLDWTLALPPTCCVTWGKLLNISLLLPLPDTTG